MGPRGVLPFSPEEIFVGIYKKKMYIMVHRKLEDNSMKLSNLLSPELIKIPLDSHDKEGTIRELVDVLARNQKVSDPRAVLDAVLEREKVMSTGVGQGIAIPHGKTESANGVVAALGISKSDIDFQAIDEQPVHIVFLLLAPPYETGLHLKALSRVSRLLSKENFRAKLLKSADAEEAMQYIQEEEKKYFEM